jgi:antitoxin ParD1/3/4
MNVSLTPELENFVNEKVKSGLYNSASEVLRESLRLLKERDMLKEIQLSELRREIMLGVEQIRNGEFVEVKASELDAFAEKLIREAKDEFKQRNGK